MQSIALNVKCFERKTISRVMSLNGHLSSFAVAGNQAIHPGGRRAALMPPVRSCFDGFTCALSVTSQAVVSLHCPSITDRHKVPVRRYISVALSLESPPPDAIPASCPCEAWTFLTCSFILCSRGHLSYSKRYKFTIFSYICPVILRQHPPSYMYKIIFLHSRFG